MARPNSRKVGSLVFLPLLVFAIGCLSSSNASAGDTDAQFLKHLYECSRTGCLKSQCIAGCEVPQPEQEETPVPSPAEAASAAQERKVTSPQELALAQWDCYSECKYQSMVAREEERAKQAGEAYKPVKYYGKWPFTRLLGIQELASALFSVLNLVATVWGVSSFSSLVYTQLPKKPMGDKGPLYEYSGLFILYGVFQANAWLWSAVFHSRDVELTEQLDYFSAIALIGMGFGLAVIRAASLRVEAARVMVAAPVIASLGTHILYLMNYEMDYGWNMIVCTVFGVATLLLWTLWAGAVHHPSALLVWFCTFGTGASMLLELYDFPPIGGLLDAHALWHAATVPLTVAWWVFVKQDAKWRTSILLKKAALRKKGSSKKTE